jgi:hypothetical protein
VPRQNPPERRSAGRTCSPPKSSPSSARVRPSVRSPVSTTTRPPSACTSAEPAGPTSSPQRPSSPRTADGRRSTLPSPRIVFATSATPPWAWSASRSAARTAIRIWATSSRARDTAPRPISATASIRSHSSSTPPMPRALRCTELRPAPRRCNPPRQRDRTRGQSADRPRRHQPLAAPYRRRPRVRAARSSAPSRS